MKTLFQMDTDNGQVATVALLDQPMILGKETIRTDVVGEDQMGQDEIGPLIALFEQVAAEQNWQPGDGLRAHRTVSVYLALTIAGTLAGGLQVVPGARADPLPYRAVWPDVETPDPATAVHVTMLALAKQYRGRAGLFWPLCVELWRWCDASGICTIFLEATPPTLRIYRRLGWPLEVVGDLRSHWGEACYLCQTTISQMEKAIIARASRSAKYRAFAEQGHR
jgi:hypothetical protein